MGLVLVMDQVLVVALDEALLVAVGMETGQVMVLVPALVEA